MTHKHELNRIGPGCWYSLHLTAKSAQTPVRKQACLEVIQIFRENFFCEICKGHFNQFILSNPPSAVLSKENGLFDWTVDAHNAVNVRNNKRVFSKEEVYDLYFGLGSTCSEDCGGHEELPPRPPGDRLMTPGKDYPFTIAYVTPRSPSNWSNTN